MLVDARASRGDVPVGSLRYPYFGTGQVFLNMLIDNSFLLVVAVGMTFVILTGGIDLSVGVGRRALDAALRRARPATAGRRYVAFPVVLLVGATLGSRWAAIIHYFEIQPFIVTLAGMFLARGLCYAITVDAVSITHPRSRRDRRVLVRASVGAVPDAGAMVRSSWSRSALYVLHSRGSGAPSTRRRQPSSRRC